MTITQKKISEIKPYPSNAKKHPQTQVDNVAESIKQFGWVQPIVIDGGGYIIIGHCRYEAALKLGYTEVPCVMVEDLSEEQVRKLRLLDNKLNESPWDMSLLEAEIFDLNFDDFNIDWKIKEDEEEIEGQVKFSEVLNEEHNYIVLYFDNDIDWLQAQTLLQLPKVKALLTNKEGTESKSFRRMGVARVLKGSEAIRRIQEA